MALNNINDNQHPQTSHHQGLTLAAPNTAKPARRICRSGLLSGRNWCRVNLQRQAPRLEGRSKRVSKVNDRYAEVSFFIWKKMTENSTQTEKSANSILA